MGYFPFFIELADQEGLIVGGGVTALRKLQKLLLYGPRLTVAAPEFCPEIQNALGVTLLRQPFVDELLDGKSFVIAATDDPALNHRISLLCGRRKIPVNVVDDKEACTFLFPALVKKGELSIGISTGGASPSAAIYLKERIEALVPDNIEELLEYLEAQRETARTFFAEESCRKAFLKELFLLCLQKARALNQEETEQVLRNCAGIGDREI